MYIWLCVFFLLTKVFCRSCYLPDWKTTRCTPERFVKNLIRVYRVICYFLAHGLRPIYCLWATSAQNNGMNLLFFITQSLLTTIVCAVGTCKEGPTPGKVHWLQQLKNLKVLGQLVTLKFCPWPQILIIPFNCQLNANIVTMKTLLYIYFF